MKELNESIKNLKLQDSAKSADEVVDSLIKYAKGQGEGGENNLQKIKAYLGEENNAFLEMQILNRLFKESMVENDRAKVRVFDSESFLNRVKELVGDTPVKYALNKDEAKLFLENLRGAKIPEKLNMEDFLKELESVENKENFISHLSKKEDAKSRLAYLNLVKPTLEEADLILHNGKRQDYIKKFRDEKGFYTLLITEENGKRLITFLPKTREDFIRNKIDNASLIQSFTSRASKQGNGLANESITQPLFKSKEAREFLELVEGFDKLYKNDAIIAKNFTQGTASKLSTSIATSAEGAIKQKVVKGGFDPIFRLLPDGVLFGLFSKQIQGGALRYHLKKALSRSLNYDDFKLKLERELKRTNFNSNTSRLIEKLMQNLEDFNAEKEAKLAQIREVKRAQELEELKRLNQIKTAQENAYHTQEANLGQDILEAELKEDFGINFEGFKGKEAVLKLLEEKRGQVKGAFYKEGLGEIDLVWGDSKKGLNHILERRKEDFIKQGLDENEALGKALEFVKKIPQIIEQGEVKIGEKRAFLETGESKAVIALDFNEANKKWILTAYNKGQNALNPAYSHQVKHNTSTSSETRANGVVNESIAQKAKSENALPLNDEPLEVEIIEEASFNEPMKFLEFQQKKLLTYIKQNTPLRLLERKIELKTRDILNFLEQSALNGKEKAFLMRNFERDLGKIELKIKEKESVKEKIKNAKTSPYPQNADEVVRIQSISKQELEQSNPQQSHLSTKESIAENSQEAKIKEAVKNYNAFYKTLPEYYGDEVGEELMIRQKELIENLAKDKKVQAFTSQWNHPFKKDGNLKGIGIHYKTKVYGKGVNKTMYVDGGGFGSATQQKKEKRLLELERERLYAAFKADFGIDGFISKYAENEFFRALWQKASAYKGIDYGWGVYPEKYYPYYENRIMPSDTITQAKEKLKNELKRIEKESVKESETIDNVKQSLFNEEANFKANFEYETQEAKQKTINKVDAYAKSEAFKALSKDKQEAILSLKSIKPGIMPENIKIQDLQHLQEHFKGKLDEKQREKFLSLFNDTKQNADLVLEVLKNGEKRQEYIKAYQHKESKDLYYIAISKNERDITGIPTTQIQKIINDIAKSERVIKAENFGEISNTAAPLPKQTSPQRSNESIAQKAKRNFTKREKKLNKVLNLSENEDKIIKEGFFETYGETSFGEKSLRQSIEENELYVKKLLTQLKELESIDKQSEQYALKLKELDKNIGDYWDNFVSKDLLYSFRETQNYADHGEKVKELRKWGQEKFQSLQNAFKEQIREPFEVLKRENANLSKNVESKNEALNKAQKAWLEAFGLKSIEEAYTPKFSKEVNEALEKVLNGEQIKLTKGSYEKLVKRDREEFLPFIKETLENADAVLKDKENAVIFVKDIGKKSYFTSVAKNANNEWIITTNSLKTLNTLKNRLNDNGELLYLSKEASNILAEAFTKRAFSNELASKSIAQKPQQKALNLQEIEQALKARISQINDEILAIERTFEDKAFREKLKEASKVKPVLEALKKEWKALEPFIVTWTHTDYSKFKPKKYYNRKPNLSNLWHIEETLDVYKGYARENERQAKQVEREIALLEKYVKLLKDKEAEVKKLETDKKALLTESYIIPVYNKLREAFKNGQHTTKQILEAKNIDIKRDSFIAKGIINEIAQLRQYLEQFFNITPLKEFGTNYAEFYKDGKGAVEKLLAEKRGQVSGAFYKEGLGEIDLVWGDDSFGLKHILNKHGGEFEDIAEELNEIIQNGEVVKRKGRDEAYNIEYKGFKVGINKGFNKQGGNKWVVTAFNDNIEKTAKTAPANDSTKGASLPLNSNESIPQNSEKLPFEMQVFGEDKLSGDEVRHLANKIGEKSTIGYFKKYLLKMDRDFHARAKDIIREYYKIEPFRKELENQWANVKEAYKNGEMSLKEFKFLSKYKDEKSFLNQVAEVLWHHSDELVKNRGHTINKYGQIEEGKANYYQNLALEYDGALKSLKKWFYYIQKANKQAQKFFNKKELEDFGINFEGFKGKEAVLKLLEEKRGQVSGAFYKEGLGEIDLVWGDENFGLKHILERRAKQWGEEKALKFISHLSENIEKGQIVELEKGRVGIKTDLTTIILDKKENNNFVLTAFRDRNNKKELESLNLSQSKTFTSENAETNAKESPVTPLNQESIIPQRSINLAMEKFHYDEKKAVDENELYKSLNESLKAGWDFFKANNKDDYNDKLFNNVIRVANDLDVRFWYQPNAKWMNGSYTYALNRIMLRSDFQTSSNAKTMLHELIHGVTSRAIYAYEDKIFRQKLSKEQIEGIEELKKLFKEVLDKNEAKAWKKAGNFKAEVELNEGANTLYGLRDEHEFLAELANPQFRSFLKEQNLFAQIIEAMAKIFSYVKEKLSGKVKSVSAKEELEGILYKIMDNYNNPHEFSTQMSEYFGSRNFVDIKRFKDYIKNNKEQFDKDNGKYPFKFFDNSKLSNAEKDAFKGKAEYEEVMDRNARIWREDDDLLALWLRSKDERIMPNYPNPLYEDERQILKKHKEQSYLKDLKNAVENYYKVNYDEFNNAFNGAFKDKHFFKAKEGDEKRDKRGGFIYNASDDVKFLLALKPYFESGLYKILDENDFKRIEENIIRILKEEHLKYRNKPLNEWLAKEWVEKDVANLLEAKASPFTQKQELENKEANVHTLREQTKELLSALVGKNITNQNDGRIASISRKNIMKMTSDKAIQKSVNNGFTPQEHFKAVQDIESLYQAAVLKETHADRKSNNPNVFIHRYTADFNGNNALITIKESLDNNSKGNKIYTLELEALELKPSAPEPQGSVTMSKNTGYAEPVTPNETHKSIIAQKSENIPQSNPHLGAGLVGGSLNGVEQDEEGNLSFDPAKFAMGFLGGTIGSKAVSMGFKHLEKNPALKEKIITELADTLAQGFDKAKAKYPLLSLLEPRYIVQNERGRKIQAKSMLKEAREKALKQEKEAIEKVLSQSTQKADILRDLDNADEILAVLLKGYQKGEKGKGAEHIRLEHTLEPTQEGYLTQDEVLNMGVKMREYLEKYGEPFIETNSKGLKSRIYEWEENDTRFRIVAGIRAKEGNTAPFPLADEIITFYSDRNLKKAMDFKNPLLNKTIADTTIQGEALSKELEKSFLDESGKINEKALNHHALDLPKSLSEEEFLSQIPFKDKKGFSKVKTPIGDISVNLAHAWKHLHKGNTYKKDRSLYSGAFLDTLTDPLFIVKQEYTLNPKLSANARETQNSKLVQNKGEESITKDSYVFFKPYKIKNKFDYLIGYTLDIKGEIINTTFIPMNKKDFGRIKKIMRAELLYQKSNEV